MAQPIFYIEYGTGQKTFLSMGFTDPVLTHNSQAKSTFTVRVPGANVITDPPIAYYQNVKIYRGAVKIFEGRQITDRRVAQPGRPADVLVFADAWHDLENLIFQQLWNYKPTAGPLVSKRFSRYILFQDFTTGIYISNGDQMREVLNYAISCGVNLQIGTIDPAQNLPFYPTRAMACSEVIQLCLKPTPDAVTWIDHSTSTPTFHCRQRGNLTGVTMPFGGGPSGGVTHESSDITPRYDLQVSQVVIDFQRTNQITSGGATATWTTFDTQAAPVGANGQAVGALVLPVDLRGYSRTDIQGTITAAAFSASDLNWWKKKHPQFADARTTALTLISDSKHPIAIVDESGVAVDLTAYPNELVDGTPNPWMTVSNNPVNVKIATVKAWFSFTEQDKDGLKSKVHNDQLVSVRVKLTNSPVGVRTYTLTTSLDTGETVPANLAQSIFNSLQALQYEGSHTVAEQYPSNALQIVGPWLKLNLSGGSVAWQTMNATIQSATHDFFRGITEITFGPAKHIAPGDLIELLVWARFRMVFESVSVRTTGQVSSSGGAAEVGKDPPKENTSAGLADVNFHAIKKIDDVDPSLAKNIHLDAANHELQLSVMPTATGIPNWSKGGFSLKVEECLGSDGLMHKVYAQELEVYDANCQLKHRIFVCSDPF